MVSVGEFYVQCPEQRLAVEQLSLSLSSLSPGALSADNLKEGHSLYFYSTTATFIIRFYLFCY